MDGGTQLWLRVDLRLLETDVKQLQLHLDWIREDLNSCGDAPPATISHIEELRDQIIARLHTLMDLDILCTQVEVLTMAVGRTSTRDSALLPPGAQGD